MIPFRRRERSKSNAGRRLNLVPAIILVLAAAAALLYYFIDPGQSLWMPKCPVKMLTGLECAGCGSQRALHALLHGDIAGAFGHNPLLLVMLPYLLLLALCESGLSRSRRLQRMLYHPVTLYAAVALIILWTILRNML